jgi:hypothetical protein
MDKKREYNYHQTFPQHSLFENFDEIILFSQKSRKKFGHILAVINVFIMHD